jgi:hypothetical protein
MFRLHFVSVVALVLVIGCGDGKIVVTGSINYEGQVPESGTIAFIADNGAGTTYGEPYTKGTYKVRLPEGEYLVRITGKKMIPLDMPLPGVFGGPPITHREEKIVPDIYGLQSKLQITVDKSTRTYDFKKKKK